MQTTTFLLYLSSSILFFILNWKQIKKRSQRLIDENGNFTSKPMQLISNQLFGAILLGITAVITSKNAILNTLIDFETITAKILVSYLIVFALILFLALNQSKNTFKNRNQSPENATQLSVLFFCSYFISRALFLFAYELWLRGNLLFETANNFGIPLAILSNVLLYVLLHIFNNKKELLACIPFGIAVCIFNLVFHAVWPAIILHISFSLAYEINFYRLNLVHSKTQSHENFNHGSYGANRS
ncbi:CPBP family intramembrane glutamic endopeptidase [Flavobacterium palustre]|uniref:CPBP family intramembrane glutamic endopeptidase n=1 Tax=Flavobacterium palustre TaxID=1476463 RepID=UPI00166476DD|nr:CPBP family intramembrane glutamic endopeptidase [Flavobacterium palustre]